MSTSSSSSSLSAATYPPRAGPSVLDAVEWNFDAPLRRAATRAPVVNGKAAQGAGGRRRRAPTAQRDVRLAEPDAGASRRYASLFRSVAGGTRAGRGDGLDKAAALGVWRRSKLEDAYLERVWSKALAWQENQRLLDDDLDETAPSGGAQIGAQAFARGMAAIDAELLENKL